MLRCALKHTSTTIDRIPAALINVELDIPDWDKVRAQLAERAKSLVGTGIHLGTG